MSPLKYQDVRYTVGCPNRVGVCMVKTSLEEENNNNAQGIRKHYLGGWLYACENPKDTMPQHHNTLRANCGDRGERGSSGSCSANGSRGCRIVANNCCSVCLCARGQNWGLTSRQHLGKNCRLPISAKHPFSADFRSWKLSELTFVSTCSVCRSYFGCILLRSRSMADIGVP